MRAGQSAVATTKASAPCQGVATVTSAQIAEQSIHSKITPADQIKEAKALRPRYLRGFAWRWDEERLEMPAAHRSLYARPLPRPPATVLAASHFSQAVVSAPHLFDIVTPIDLNEFERLLGTHPNRPFVDSVIVGLREGFWPFVDSADLSGPALDNHHTVELQPEKLHELRDTELRARRFSEGFTELLPGMRVTPLGLVPKPRSEKLRLITDHSAGDFPLNDLIPRDERSVAYDSMHVFAPWLVHHRHRTPSGEPPIAWKSDVSSAFRLLPMHPAWQMLQVVCIEGVYYVDRNAVFGSGASPRLWCDFFSLVLWIAVYRIGIKCLLSFMDDSWGLETSRILIPFRGHSIPRNQAQFLSLLDRLRIPWSWDKQAHGRELEIIGFLVDTRHLSLSLAADRKTELITALREFVKQPHRTLREFQRMTGWASWALNVFPWGRWALQSSWDKIAGKRWPHARIPVNREVKRDLQWLADCYESFDGLMLLKALVWHPNEADATYECDACPRGLGVYSRSTNEGWYARFSSTTSIHYAESLAVYTAFTIALSAGHRKVLIYTDCESSIGLFSSHRPMPEVAPLLREWCRMSLEFQAQPRVLHLKGNLNLTADALSRGQLTIARSLRPSIIIHAIDPPNLHNPALVDGSCTPRNFSGTSTKAADMVA